MNYGFLITVLVHSKAHTRKFGSPVMQAPAVQPTIAAHNAGYFTTGVVQSIKTPLTPTKMALAGEVAFYTLIYVLIIP